MNLLNETHDPSRRSWVPSANATDSDFPLQNLPFGVFRTPERAPRGGIAIGDMILDLRAAAEAGLFAAEAAKVARLAAGAKLNALMALPPAPVSALRAAISDLLRAGGPRQSSAERRASDILVPMAEATLLLPADIGGFTDFFTSLHHVTRVGGIIRPGSPLPPSFKFLPMAYNGRASSVAVSGEPVVRPRSEIKFGDDDIRFAPSRELDFELEVGVYVAGGNTLGERIPMGNAAAHIFGLCLLNDWSARDIQRWESFPLGPFLGKTFCTSVSPWIVTAEALAPFRAPATTRTASDPAPLPHLQDASDQAEGGFDIALTGTIHSAAMRERNTAPVVITRSNFKDLYWTCAQMIAHHTANGCNLRPGDLLGSGTVSGPSDEGRACMLELSAGGRQPLALGGGETRAWLEDGDELIIRGRAERDGFVSIGFGECRARIMPAAAD